MEQSTIRSGINFARLANHKALQIEQARQSFKSQCLAQLGTEEEVLEALSYCYNAECEIRNSKVVWSRELGETLSKVTTWLLNPNSKPWLFIYGPVGNGKTTLLKAIVMLINSQSLKYGCYTVSMKPYTALRLADLSKENKEYFDNVKNFEVIAIDDIGIEPVEVNDFGTKISPMVELLLKRYDSRRMTIFTSNLSPEAMEIRYRERVADRMKEVCDYLYIGRDSYR